MGAFGGLIKHTALLNIETDPAGNDVYQLMRMPAAATVIGAYYVGENAQAAGTGITFQLLNYGTAGTAVQSGGTVTNALGTGIAADVPTAFTVNASQAQLDEGEWLVWLGTEVGGGWQSGDRYQLQVDYVLGK
jgi:hypothetical protein